MAGLSGSRSAARCPNWCSAIPARPANGGYAEMENAARCRMCSAIRSVLISSRCGRANNCERNGRISMDRLRGKVAMVVGAGSIGPGWGNGKATAVTFAREGAQVFCVDRNPAAAEETVKIITGEGGKAIAHTADVSRASEVEAMVTACMRAHGRIDVLDNNVGIAEVGSVVEVDETSWDRVFAVNLKSAYRSMKHVIPLMVKQGG